MKKIIEDLFKYERNLLGEGYDKSLSYINKILPLEIKKIQSRTKVGDWIVPDEWVLNDAWIKYKGKKILQLEGNSLCVTNYSLPVHKKVKLEELKKHLHTSTEIPEAMPYDYRFYERDWGFSMPKVEADKLEEGEYEVFIDARDELGEMKIGVHTIQGKMDREVLLFAHLDHPFQANDNLSAVACLVDMAKNLYGFEHTIKIIFCPETIGSVAYAETSDISMVDFVISVDSIGNDNTLLWQKSFDVNHRINAVAHLAVAGQGVSYRKGEFRLVAGADEYYFNDPLLNIPGLFISRLPYKEYHTSFDTPDKINYEKIEEVQKVILEIIRIYESDWIPCRSPEKKGMLMRSRHGIQTDDKLVNRDLDYLYYGINGEKYVSQLTIGLGLGFDFVNQTLKKLLKDEIIYRTYSEQEIFKKTTRKKHS